MSFTAVPADVSPRQRYRVQNVSRSRGAPSSRPRWRTPRGSRSSRAERGYARLRTHGHGHGGGAIPTRTRVPVAGGSTALTQALIRANCKRTIRLEFQVSRRAVRRDAIRIVVHASCCRDGETKIRSKPGHQSAAVVVLRGGLSPAGARTRRCARPTDAMARRRRRCHRPAVLVAPRCRRWPSSPRRRPDHIRATRSGPPLPVA